MKVEIIAPDDESRHLLNDRLRLSTASWLHTHQLLHEMLDLLQHVENQRSAMAMRNNNTRSDHLNGVHKASLLSTVRRPPPRSLARNQGIERVRRKLASSES